jgi:TetR/AcrR family transcriptional repressor of nem operon
MRRTRDLEGTRRRILEAAFEEIYAHGFQGRSIDKIVARTHLTKGALFNIFPTKLSLGYAVMDEVVADMIRRQWVVPLEGADDCLEVIARSFEVGARELEGMPVHYGSPLNNLAQEMSAIDTGFKTRTLHVFNQWIAGLQRALERGQQAGVVRADANPRDAAILLVTLIEGILSLAKTSQDPGVLHAGARNIRSVLESLRAASYPA